MLDLNFTFQPGLNVNQILAFEMAGQVWSHFLQDDIAVDIHVSVTRQLPDYVLGGAIPSYQSVDYQSVQSALENDVTSGNDALAVGAIGNDGEFSAIVSGTEYTGDSVTLTQAQVSALGLESVPDADELDGYIVINDLRKSALKWSYDFGRTESLDRNEVDLLSVALHEVGHVLGFVSGLDSPTLPTISQQLAQTTILDLFRYSDRSYDASANELTRGAAAYFSIDGGTSNLAPLAAGVVPIGNYAQGYQASHWGITNQNTQVEAALEKGPVIEFINTVVGLATPLTAADQVDSVEQLLAYANGGVVDNTVQLILGQEGDNLGVLDPTLAPEERSSISALDLIAFDVIGYDIAQSDNLELDYQGLLQEAKDQVSERLGLDPKDLNKALTKNVKVWGKDRLSDVISAINANEVFERRRRRRRVTRSASFFQEEDSELDQIEIKSDGGGHQAELVIESGGTWVTQVESWARSPLTLVTQSGQGSEHNDLIIQAGSRVVDKAGHNVVYLGSAGGEIETGEGHDILYGNGGNVVIADDGGDNTILLQGGSHQQHDVRTGAGHDTLELTASRATIHSGDGDDRIFARNLSSSSYLNPSHYLVTALGGNNQIKLEGNQYQSLLVTTGAGHDQLDLAGQSATLNLGNGRNQLQLEANDTDVSGGAGTDHFVIEGGANSDHAINLAQGHDRLSVVGKTIEVRAGRGNDWIDLQSHRDTVNAEFTVIADQGNHVVRLGGDRKASHTVTFGAGNDVIQAQAGSVALTTGDGQDLIILGTKTQQSFDLDGVNDALTVQDLSSQDYVMLHGDRQDYSESRNYLFYKGEFIAKFEGGIDFDLESDRVLYAGTEDTPNSLTLPKFLQSSVRALEKINLVDPLEDIDNPQREAILQEAQNRLLATEEVSYRIQGGADAELFQIHESTGALSFLNPADAQNPLDANQDGEYVVRVEARQGGGETQRVWDRQLLKIRVEDLPTQYEQSQIGNDFDNSLVGTEQADVIEGRSGEDVIQGNGGSDLLWGGSGNDALFGDAGNDTLVGSNSLRQGASEIDHYVEGGEGADLFVLGDVNSAYYAAAEGEDYMFVADFQVGVDRVSLHGNEADYRLESEEGNSWLYYRDDAIAVFDRLANLQWQDLVGADRSIFDPGIPIDLDESVDSPIEQPSVDLAFDDILNGTAQADSLDGNAGNDILRGRVGADVLVGGLGNDTLFGQDGHDSLQGTTSVAKGRNELDVLLGGKGEDVFILGDASSAFYDQNGRADQATIKDFELGRDRLQLHGSSNQYKINISGQNQVLLYRGDRIALLQKTQGLTLDSDALEFLS